jgi:hypothetical protein
MQNEDNNPIVPAFLFEDTEIYSGHDTDGNVPPPVSGENLKGVVVAFESGNADSLDPADYDQLVKILGALKLQVSDVALIDTQWLYKYGFAALMNSNVEFSRFIGFGTSAVKMGLTVSLKRYATSSFREKKMLFSHSLAQIQQDPKLKGALWAELQVMFDLKKP